MRSSVRADYHDSLEEFIVCATEHKKVAMSLVPSSFFLQNDFWGSHFVSGQQRHHGVVTGPSAYQTDQIRGVVAKSANSDSTPRRKASAYGTPQGFPC